MSVLERVLSIDALLGVIASLVAGGVIGILYFGGLWLTVQRLPGKRRPELLILASFLARMALLLTALFWLAAGQIERLTAALVGLLAARIVLTRRLGPEQNDGNHA